MLELPFFSSVLPTFVRYFFYEEASRRRIYVELIIVNLFQFVLVLP